MTTDAKEIGEIIDNLRRVFQTVNEYSKKAKQTAGLTGPQLWTIKVVSELSPVKVSDLARNMYLHPATMVGIIDRLEKKGLVSRTRSESDRRVVLITLTSQGEDLISKAPEVAQGLLVSGLKALPLARQKAIGEALSHLVKILKAQNLPPRLMAE